MENTSEKKDKNSVKKPLKHICIGLVAHVDAGKTTLSEGMLYLSGQIRNMGRVDHGDTFLDNYETERERGITIFSKQAEFIWNDTSITILDTPGHVDFSAEMERVLQVLDCAVLVVSAVDGVQAHTVTLWRLLKQYKIPTMIFVNKMDRQEADREKLLEELKNRFGDGCVEMDMQSEENKESLAMCDETMLEEYLSGGKIEKETVKKAVAARKVFPCWFGSALKAQGIEALMSGLCEYAPSAEPLPEFGAKVYKIARDPQGNRLTYLKVTGGQLRVKDVPFAAEQSCTGKVNQIRKYSGEKYELVQTVSAGEVCAVTGLEGTYPGQGIGAQKESLLPVLEPVMTYRIELPDGCDAHKMFQNLRCLEEEDPQLHVIRNEETSEIHIRLMGEVQTEVLQKMVKDRFGVLIHFGEGRIVYKETIKNSVEGAGHFEPLRHYAEVHLRLEPGERGSGMQFAADCSEDVLDRNYQRLILTHLEEREHKGVLTGSALTDVRITLLSGKAHKKHTEGGDFRQATYRAVRQGLRKAESVLLEPYYEFRMELPLENVGKAMTDIKRMSGEFEGPETENGMAVLKGSVPAAEMNGYQKEFTAYTGGYGRLFCSLKGYGECHNTEEVIGQIGYDADADVENTADSVFCSHRAGTIVPWYEADAHMHVEGEAAEKSEEDTQMSAAFRPQRRTIELTQEELDAIYVRTPDPVKKTKRSAPVTVTAGKAAAFCNGDRLQSRNVPFDISGDYTKTKKKKADRKEYLLVDGYNIIFAWDSLKELAKIDLAAARGKLADILCNYQGYKQCELILVFDAYKVEGNPGEIMKYHNIHVVYTREAETADHYIEKTVRRIAKEHDVIVATSDALEQVIIMGQGAHRMSAAGLKEEIESVIEQMKDDYPKQEELIRNYLFDYLEKDIAEEMERVRLGSHKKKWTV